MPPSPTTHPSTERLKAYALGKLPPAELQAIAQHLETCPQCLKIASGRHADSFVGKLRAAQPPAATADWSPQSLLDGRAAAAPAGGADVPAELRQSSKYRIERELGRGGMGVIYLAEHVMMGKRVALKVINRALLAHPDAQVRFQTEVRAAARLDHPNIVRALDADRLGELHLLVMEYVDGLSLAEVLQRKGPFPLVHACHYIRQAALGLQHACEQGMVHRDIKPHNLMLTRDGKVKILDFGLARLARGKASKPGVTQVGDFMGTPDYVSPEQAMDASRADIRADLYSLGCTFYCLLAGRPPFRASGELQVIMAHMEKDVPPLTDLRSDVPAKLWTVLARLLEKDPSKRYQKPVELAQALAPFCKPRAKRPAAAAPPLALPVDSPQVATQLGGDTRRPPAPPIAPAVVPPLATPVPAPFAELDAPAPAESRPHPPRSGAGARATGGRRRMLVAGGISAGVLLLGVGGWLLSGTMFPVRTPDRIVERDGEQPQKKTTAVVPSKKKSKDADGKGAANPQIPTKSEPSLADCIKDLSDRTPDIRIRAAQRLGEMGNRAGDAFVHLKDCLVGEKDAIVRAAIVFAIGQIARESLAASGDTGLDETLCQILRSDSETPLVRRGAAKALGGLNTKSARALEALTAALGDSDAVVRQNAASSLGLFRTDGLPALKKALRDTEPLVQREAAIALLEVPEGGKVHKLVPELLPLCQSTNSEVRRAGLEVLVRVVDKDDKQALPILRSLLEDSDPVNKRLAALTMCNIGGKQAAPALPLLLNELRAGDIERRRVAIACIGNLGEVAAPAVLELVKLMRNDSDLEVRCYASGALGSIGEAGDEVVKALVDRVCDKMDAPKLRAAAATALSWLSLKAPARTHGAITELLVVLQDAAEDANVRMRVIWAMRPNTAALPGIPGAFDVFSSAVKEPKTSVNAMVRYDSAHMLGVGWREKIPEPALDVLSEFLRDPSFIIFDRNTTRVGDGQVVAEERGSGDARIMVTQALSAMGVRRWSGRADIVQQLRLLAADTKIFPELRRQAQELVKLLQ